MPVMVLGDRLGGKTADANFVVRDGALEPIDPGIFERKPSEIIRIFQLAIELDVPLALRTREQLGELAASQPASAARGRRGGPALRPDLLCDTRDRANPSRLEQMQDLGILGAIMPEWEPSTGRVQHDIYHVYTVDQHALYAVGRLHALQRGDHAAVFPIPTETVPEVTRPIALAIGTLLHDVGKPYGSPHSEIGAGLAVAICRRLGIEEEDTQRVEFLVRQHLVMGQMSQRRDLEDLGMISDFGAVCGNEENLRELYLLTFCDLASVAPDAMSSWKETLLAELYTRTLAFLRRGPDLLGSERAEIVAERQKGAARLLGEPLPEGGGDSALVRLFAGFPSRYFAENAEMRIAAHVRLMRARREQGKCSLIDVSHDARLGMTEMVLAAADTPGLLADVAGVLYANRIEVVDAAIYSRQPADPKEAPEALDVFRVRDSMGRPVTAEARWTKVSSDLEAVVSGPDQGGDPGGGPAAHGVGGQLEDAGGADGVQDRQHRQPRFHGRRGDYGGSARRPIRDRARAVTWRAWTSTVPRSPPRPTAPSTCSTCVTRRPWTRSPTPNGRPTCATRCSGCSPASTPRSWRGAG